jgi:hypothetical protein
MGEQNTVPPFLLTFFSGELPSEDDHMYSIQDISNKIVEAVEASSNKTVLGVHLGSLLRISFPDFEPLHYQCRNLRHFIKMYVPNVAEKGRSGQDLVYTLKAMATTPAQAVSDSLRQTLVVPASVRSPEFIPLPTTGYNWKAYSNPSYPFAVTANRETGEIRIVPENVPTQLPWVVIPKPSSEFHRQIASDFVSTLQEPTKSNLMRLLSNDKWYVQFSDATKRSDVGPLWTAFRRERLIGAFKEALRDLGIPEKPQLARQVSTLAAHFAPQSATAAQGASAGNEPATRELVQRVIASLPLAELRSLRLPVGDVLDALRR